MIRPIEASDTSAVCEIYNHYVLHSVITFEEEPVSTAEMQERIRGITATLPWLVYVEEKQIVAYAYASAWKARAAYRHSAECTIYLRNGYSGRGIGSALYARLLTEISQRGIHALIGGIALPNEASVALHEKMGFEKVAHFREVGYKMGRWIDVAYWEKIL